MASQRRSTFLSVRYQALSQYHLTKQLSAVNGHELVVEVHAFFLKQNTKFASRFLENLTIENERIKRWEYVGVMSEAVDTKT
jgi:hypothetical protein